MIPDPGLFMGAPPPAHEPSTHEARSNKRKRARKAARKRAKAARRRNRSKR